MCADKNFKMPLGSVIATCHLVDCVPIDFSCSYGYAGEAYAELRSGTRIEGNELAFGDYTPGRFAWILDDVRALPEPVPARGMLGLWEWEVPEGVKINGQQQN